MTSADRNKKMKAMFGGLDVQTLADQATEPAPSPTPSEKRVTSGAVKSMQGAFSAIEAENDRLRQQLLDSEQIIEIDPVVIDPSFVADRMHVDNDAEFEAFVESIAQSGQQVPILVRPSPSAAGRYQVAYGHRRLRAAKRLERPVKAIVRQLSDNDLVVAQGKENSERADLSFIEQATFAAALKERKFDRATIAAALGRSDQKGLAYISIITSLAAALPKELVQAIGPAPKSGRPKWEKLTALVSDSRLSKAQSAEFEKLSGSDAWKRADSDRRLVIVTKLLEKGQASRSEVVSIAPGVNWSRGASRTQIIISEKEAPGLSAWLEKELPALLARYKERSDDQ